MGLVNGNDSKGSEAGCAEYVSLINTYNVMPRRIQNNNIIEGNKVTRIDPHSHVYRHVLTQAFSIVKTMSVTKEHQNKCLARTSNLQCVHIY